MRVADGIVGEYVALDNDSLRATVKIPKQGDDPTPTKHLIFPLHRTAAEWKKALGALEINPDDWGLSRRTYRENRMMGHADWPGFDFWLPLSDDRLARYIVPSTHMPGKEWPVREVILMRKSGEPATPTKRPRDAEDNREGRRPSSGGAVGCEGGKGTDPLRRKPR